MKQKKFFKIIGGKNAEVIAIGMHFVKSEDVLHQLYKPPIPFGGKKKEMNNEIENIADFIYESMCIDGFVKFHHFESIEINGKKIMGIIFEVTDRKRGNFYIGWYK